MLYITSLVLTYNWKFVPSDPLPPIPHPPEMEQDPMVPAPHALRLPFVCGKTLAKE